MPKQTQQAEEALRGLQRQLSNPNPSPNPSPSPTPSPTPTPTPNPKPKPNPNPNPSLTLTIDQAGLAPQPPADLLAQIG